MLLQSACSVSPTSEGLDIAQSKGEAIATEVLNE
jgi:hypothetical protein